ncbi:MAG: hypothetical protein ACK5MR_18145 [Cumulibacter sp.]
MRVKKFAAVAMMAVPVLALSACGGKPPEGDLHKAIESALVEAGAEEADAAAYADCAAPKMHEELSGDTLEKIIENPMGNKMVDQDDVAPYNDIDQACQEEVLGTA